MTELMSRQDFPVLSQKVNDENLIYLDNAATSQIPEGVIQAMVDHYHLDHANIHRGVHTLAQRSTDAFENARAAVAEFIHADVNEVIFNRGTSEGMNFLIQSCLSQFLSEGDIVLTSRLEHHSTLVPLQEVCQRTGSHIEFFDLDSAYQVQLKPWLKAPADKLTRVKAVVIHHVSNVLGVCQDIQAISDWARKNNILLFVDGAQAVAHQAVNVKELGVDGYCFSSHKMHGPTGIGICYLRHALSDKTPPMMFGGEMIQDVGDYASTFKESPWKYEAGTMPISQVVGLHAAVDYLNQVGMEKIHHHQNELIEYAYQQLQAMDGIELYQDDVTDKNGIISFNIQGVHPHDAATAYDLEGIALRAGHHCCQPLMRLLNVPATLRLSTAGYNNLEEIETFIAVTKKVKEFFQWD